MGRPVITSGKRTERVVPVTFSTVEEKQAMQAHAKQQGRTLAGLIKYLLAQDARTVPAATAATGTDG